jgi:peptide/nickel transport system substrate-binding protein
VFHRQPRARTGGAWRRRTAPYALALAAAVSSASCARDAADGARPRVVLRIGYPAYVGGQRIGIGSVANLLVGEGLTRTMRNGRHEPRLAERWRLSPDGLTLDVRLRPGLKFSNGAPLTAADVKTSLLEGALEYPLLAEIDRIDDAGGGDLLVRMRQPTTLILDELEVDVRRRAGTTTVLTGPFVREPDEGDTRVFSANPHYFRGRPQIDEIRLKGYPTLRLAWTSLMRDEIDFLYEMTDDAREFLEKESGVRVFSALRPYVFTLLFNQRAPLFASRLVRTALNYAVDRDAILKAALKGHGETARSAVWPRHWAHAGEASAFAFNPARASRLLAEAGYPDAIRAGTDGGAPARVRFSCLLVPDDSRFEHIATLLQKQFFDIGVDMQIESVSLEALVRRMEQGTYDALLIDLNGGPALVRPYQLWHTPRRPVRLSFAHGPADAPLDALNAATSDEEIRAATRAFQQVLFDDPPAIFIAWPHVSRAVSRRFEVPPTDGDVLATIWQWRPAAGR